MGFIYYILPVMATVQAEVAKIDYSKQPPRNLQLAAGTSMAIAGFIVTFLVLGIFTVLIKIIAILGQKYEARKASVPSIATPSVPSVAPAAPPAMMEDYTGIAAAAAAVAAIIARSRSVAGGRAGGVDAWVLGERVSPLGRERGDELSLRESVRWRRR